MLHRFQKDLIVRMNLRLGLNRAIKEASKFFLVLVIIDAVDEIDRV